MTTSQAKRALRRPLTFGDQAQIEALEILYYGTRQPDDNVILLEVRMDARALSAELEKAAAADAQAHPETYAANASKYRGRKAKR